MDICEKIARGEQIRSKFFKKAGSMSDQLSLLVNMAVMKHHDHAKSMSSALNCDTAFDLAKFMSKAKLLEI